MSGINYNEYCRLQKEIEELSRKKNADYGCDSLIRFGNFGILIRLSDKLDRLKSLYKNNKLQVTDEKLEDTLKDIVNYAMYMILQERNILVDNKLIKNDPTKKII